MPTDRDLVREASSTRLICDALARLGPWTQFQLSSHLGVSVSCTCKCLKLLSDEGYVQRVGRAANSIGLETGRRPWLYARTRKCLPEIPSGSSTNSSSLHDLSDRLNAIIRKGRHQLRCGIDSRTQEKFVE